VVEDPGAVEAVDACPQGGAAEVVIQRDLDEAFPRRFLVCRRDSVFEVSEQHIYPRNKLRNLGPHLLVLRGEEVDHAIRACGDLDRRRWRADREWSCEGPGITHGEETG